MSRPGEAPGSCPSTSPRARRSPLSGACREAAMPDRSAGQRARCDEGAVPDALEPRHRGLRRSAGASRSGTPRRSRTRGSKNPPAVRKQLVGGSPGDPRSSARDPSSSRPHRRVLRARRGARARPRNRERSRRSTPRGSESAGPAWPRRHVDCRPLRCDRRRQRRRRLDRQPPRRFARGRAVSNRPSTRRRTSPSQPASDRLVARNVPQQEAD